MQWYALITGTMGSLTYITCLLARWKCVRHSYADNTSLDSMVCSNYIHVYMQVLTGPGIVMHISRRLCHLY